MHDVYIQYQFFTPMKHHKYAWIELGRRIDTVARAVHSRDASLLESKAAHGLYRAAFEAERQNPWFTQASVVRSLQALAHMLRPGAVDKWLNTYFNHQEDTIDSKNKGQGLEDASNSTYKSQLLEDTDSTQPSTSHNPQPATCNPQPITILLIMAGNIPLVGFHDMLCVLASGHRLLAKVSSQDKELPLAMGRLIGGIEPAMTQRIEFVEGPALNFDAVIATGSNNSSRYFDYYFGKHPHIIRRNRTSLAVLSGNESKEELTALADDVFAYFGLGCRNVSMLWVPQGYDLEALGEAWQGVGETLRMHGKYMNNYDYQKAIMLVNKVPFTDTGFCMFREDASLHSPVSVLHIQRYKNLNDLQPFLAENRNALQCIVTGLEVSRHLSGIQGQYLSEKPALSGKPDLFDEPDLSGKPNLSGKPGLSSKLGLSDTNSPLVPFGAGQTPELWDYADGVDTMRFLLG